MSNPNVPDSTAAIVSRLLARVPSDVIVVLSFLAVVDLSIVVVGLESSPLRVALGAPLLLLLPGYVLVATLFPRSTVPETRQRASGSSFFPKQFWALNGPERAALSFGLSLAILPLFALVVAFSRWSFTVDAVVLGLSLFVFLGAVTSVLTRSAVSPEARFEVSMLAWSGRIWKFMFAGNLRNSVVNVALVLSIVLSVAVVGFAFAAPQDGERYSEMTLLTETEDGEYVAGEYPEVFTTGEQRELVVGIENNEQVQTEYTVVTRVERVSTSDGSVAVLEANEVRRRVVTLDAGEQRYDNHAVTLDTTGEDLRLSYYLYRDGVPETVNEETAYRHTFIWVDATDDSSETSQSLRRS